MPDCALDWLDDLPDLRVPGVPGVPPQRSAVPAGTPQDLAGVPGVPVRARNILEHLPLRQGVPDNVLNSRQEHLEHLGTPGTSDIGASASVPQEITAGIAILRTRKPPQISRPQVWAEIVADAARLLSEDWAKKALALGWHPLELFGCSPAIGGDADLDSLAIWLSGRRLLLIDERSAIAAEGPDRAVFPRFNPDGARYLWELADIQRERKAGLT